MPELPEVQTIINDLNKKIKGDTITGFWTDWPRAIKNQSVKKFTHAIKDRKILGARRIGKNLFLDLSGGKTLYIHLKMTGHLLIKLKNRNQKAKFFKDKVNQYIHHIWFLGKNKTLEFSDVRKFAKIALVDTEKINSLPEIKKLGIDALSPQLTPIKFKEILAERKNKPIGLVLMEQELIAGIGNIYRSEILFEAGINPQKKIRYLKEKEVFKLRAAIVKILKKAIKMRGTSDSDYRDTAGAPGNFQKILKVYRKEKKGCQKCGTMISRIIMGQRSVFFCPVCQK